MLILYPFFKDIVTLSYLFYFEVKQGRFTRNCPSYGFKARYWFVLVYFKNAYQCNKTQDIKVIKPWFFTL